MGHKKGGLSGGIWIFLEPSGAIQSHLELFGATWTIWSYMESSGAFWSHLKLSGLI